MHFNHGNVHSSCFTRTNSNAVNSSKNGAIISDGNHLRVTSLRKINTFEWFICTICKETFFFFFFQLMFHSIILRLFQNYFK